MEEFLSNVQTDLNQKFPGEVLTAEVLYNFPVLTVKPGRIHELLRYLKEDANHQFHFLTDLTGMQTPDEKELGVIYHLHNMPKNKRIRIKTFFSITKPEIKSVTDLWPGANWMERETYDFFGIRFQGHPNLKRILNVDEMDIFPLRKEYPLEDQTRDDKSDKMFGR